MNGPKKISDSLIGKKFIQPHFRKEDANSYDLDTDLTIQNDELLIINSKFKYLSIIFFLVVFLLIAIVLMLICLLLKQRKKMLKILKSEKREFFQMNVFDDNFS